MMNQLLKTIEVTNSEDWADSLNQIEAEIHIVGVDSDLFFTPEENIDTYFRLKNIKSNIYYNELTSIHGHDAFLIEYEKSFLYLQ